MNRTLGFRHVNFNPGALTFAFRSQDDGTVLASVAFCSPKDSFKKARGRQIAEGRFIANSHTFSFHRDHGLHIIDDLVRGLTNSEVKLPGWCSKLLRSVKNSRQDMKDLVELFQKFLGLPDNTECFSNQG